ncbi:hypothetical protein BREVNS_1910 [Brevinematales bacterium NS]|nr:hypothetical protein BREVNS_1910 [Brevinematales bacterium NS]
MQRSQLGRRAKPLTQTGEENTCARVSKNMLLKFDILVFWW